MKLPNLRSPMVQQMRTRNYMTPVQASKSPGETDTVVPLSKRDMLGGAVASAAAALPLAANAGVILEDPNKQPPREKESRPGLLLAVPAVAVGWVGFNILGPALNQLDDMGEVAKAREAP